MSPQNINGAEPPPEFSRVVNADTVQRKEVVEVIEAGEAERRNLAERLELEAIDSLKAKVRLRRVRGGQMVRVTGELDADVVQTCVVTLDPVKNHVRESFEALFAPESLIPDSGDELEFDMASLEEDVPEPMVNNRIDIGELTAQHLSLALDPYPRCPGVELPAEYTMIDEGDEDEEATPEPERPNPFAVLSQLKRPQ
ncbi:MAG TPA: DUF177 domain-containing protein [Azospirillum sp.]|nr:DUF177 domain-containing protein [Azospirillum sp.]